MNENQNSSNDRNRPTQAMRGLHPNQYIVDETTQFFSDDNYAGYEGYHDGYRDTRAGYKPYPNEVREFTGVRPFVQPTHAPQHANTQARQYQQGSQRQKDRRNIVILLGICAAIVAAGLTLLLMLSGSNPNTVSLVAQPDSASQVAAKLACTNYTAAKSLGESGMVVSAGSCMKDGKKYAINTFVTQDVRDAWLKAAEPLGVNPMWETATSVTYPSVTS